MQVLPLDTWRRKSSLPIASATMAFRNPPLNRIKGKIPPCCKEMIFFSSWMLFKSLFWNMIDLVIVNVCKNVFVDLLVPITGKKLIQKTLFSGEKQQLPRSRIIASFNFSWQISQVKLICRFTCECENLTHSTWLHQQGRFGKKGKESFLLDSLPLLCNRNL